MPPSPASVRYPDPGAIFASTADAYVRYRPEHPTALIEYVTDLARPGAHYTNAPILDLGCGPGVIALRLAERALPVLAIDPSEEMLDAGRRLATERGIDDVEWTLGDSADVAGLPAVRGAVIADAFHYMDREQTLNDLDTIILPGGFVALVVSHVIGTPKAWWEPILDRLRDRFLGEHRAAGVGVPFHYLTEDHETVLRRSPFARVRVLRVDQPLALTLDEVIGMQATYAFSSPAVLGEQRDAYEQALRKALTVLEPSGRFTATVQAAVIVGQRP
ncbi:class I SAM-dependent methyltransferase [Microtetraspora malaysiensis]|uniref:class I SAM-dependent methyltransferase n=1 Tax=Microtetraspora malaysiensis TaxID=161358 RepID=UPI000B102B56|nr:class I SAM-dependent methyltransferase [Microtetraspora malaysiensis]